MPKYNIIDLMFLTPLSCRIYMVNLWLSDRQTAQELLQHAGLRDVLRRNLHHECFSPGSMTDSFVQGMGWPTEPAPEHPDMYRRLKEEP
jgi:hypothetical protein